jgi:hypothetical protein
MVLFPHGQQTRIPNYYMMAAGAATIAELAANDRWFLNP